MVAALESVDLRELPPPPENSLSYRQKLHVMRNFHTGFGKLRDADGPVARFTMGPRWLIPPIVVATSPRAARDILGRSDAFVDEPLPTSNPFLT
jgi:hypothetical protein